MAGNRARYEAALSRGHSFSWDQRWEAAVQEFQAAIAEFPSEPAPYAGLGMAYSEMGQLGEALENYKLAARHAKGDIIYLRHVADVQEQLGMAREAGQTYMAVGEVALRRSDLDQAVVNWHRAVRLAPTLLGGHQRLAQFYTQQGQVRAAIREYLSVARLLQARGQIDKAVQTCRAALNLDPRNREVLTALEMLQHGDPIYVDEQMTPAGSLGTNGSAGTHGEGVQELVGDVAGRPLERAATPVQSARRRALAQLAEQLFGEGEEELVASGALSTAQRHALISQALDFQTRNMVDEAIRNYEEAMNGVATTSAAHFNLGLLYQESLRFEDAIREFQKALPDSDYRLAGHFALGESYRARGLIHEAVEHFIAALKIIDGTTVDEARAGHLVELYDNLAESLLEKSEPEKATKFANAFVDFMGQPDWEEQLHDARTRLDALDGERMMILGDILTAGSTSVLESLYLSQEYVERDMFGTAIEEIYRAIAHSPDYLPAHIQLGELLARQDRIDAAVAKFGAVGDTYRVRGDLNGAVAMYERVLAISPLNLSVRSRLVSLLRQRGQLDSALEHHQALGEAYYQLAQVDKARETYQEALSLASRVSSGQEWRLRLMRRMADIDMQRFDWRRALPLYREIREAAPDDEETALALVDLYFKVGQPGHAVRALDQFLKQLVSSGRGGQITRILENVAERYPDEPALVQRLVRLYLAQQRREDAIHFLDAFGERQLDAGETKKAIATMEWLVQLNPPNVLSYQQLLDQLRAEA